MGWAEKRVEEYKQGQSASWLEKILIGYYSPINITLFIVGVPMLIYGLWTHSWLWITLGALSSIIAGNLYAWSTGWAEKRIDEHKTGARNPTWWEKRGLEESHPLFFPLGLISAVIFFYGFWAHNWWLNGFSLGLGFLGRFFPWLEK